MKTILGLIGAPGAGKDFLADFLVEKGFRKFAFADKIKEEYYKIIGITEETFKSCRETEEEKAIRAGLWKYSDEMKAKYGSMYFITPLIDDIKKCNSSVVISDVRTSEELSEILNLSANIIYVYRDDLDINSEYVPGTRIKIEKIFKHKIFYNHFNSLDLARTQMESFFYEVLNGGVD